MFHFLLLLGNETKLFVGRMTHGDALKRTEQLKHETIEPGYKFLHTNFHKRILILRKNSTERFNILSNCTQNIPCYRFEY